MSDFQGNFVWYELMTTDTAAAKFFYGDVVGWTAADMDMPGAPGSSYTILSAGDGQVAGLMDLPDGPRAAGASPFWIGYIWADDVDQMADRVTKAGGSIHRAPTDIPGVGRFAVAADPHGAAFCLFRGMPSGNGSGRPALMTPGHTGWHELMAGNLDEAFAFYSGLFGWTKSNAVDMGPMGVYQVFAKDGVDFGGMMTKPAECPMPFWGYYFTVPKIAPALERVKADGGKVTNGPMEVPGGAWILQGIDPQGARFALVAPPVGA